MTPEAAINSFFSGIGINVYASSSVPDQEPFPYMTYDLSVGTIWDGDQSITVNIWNRTDSEAWMNAKARELSKMIGAGGKILPCDGGSVWLKRGDPWCQSMSDEEDKTVKRRYINVTAEFITAD